MAVSSWTEEQIAEVLDQWSRGRSATQIAMSMPGRTRNAVIGVLHRRHAPPRIKMVRKVVTPPARKIILVQPPVPLLPRPVERPVFAPPPEGGVAFLDLEDCMCRWPLGTVYCGAGTPIRQSYCAEHAKRGRGVTPERKKVVPAYTTRLRLTT